MTAEARSLPLAFTAKGIALNARALRSQAVWSGDDRVALVFDPGGLDADERRALERLPAGRCLPLRPAQHGPGGMPVAERGLGSHESQDWLLICRGQDLRSLRSEHPLGEHLLAAQAALERPPREPQLMGVINVTPDSFSDGGLYLDAQRAIEHGLALEADGASLLDVGGESTRPGASPVPLAVELERVLPVVRGLARSCGAGISIDTTKSEVARAALDAGATWVNDVSAGRRDPQMLALVAAREAVFVAVHSQGDPGDMQVDPRYRDPVAEIARFLRERVADCLKAGIEPSRIVLDPGIGFGKRLDHNLALLRRLPELRSLGQPLLLGVSRKAFIGHLSGAEKQGDWKDRESRDRPMDRLGGTAAAVTACVLEGVEFLRVHDVRVMAEAARVARGIAGFQPLPSPPR